ncbi:MAG: FAD-dependent monooxygenase [Rhodobacteraceae bacterium]|nr:FAD-dependent monooxygenase [Paracoccaceae bacterium]
MRPDTDIIIVGGGLCGPVLAIAVAGTGLRVTLIDALPVATRRAAGFDGRGYALALTSVRMLQALGIWDERRTRAQPILDIKVACCRTGEGTSPRLVHFNHRDMEEGPMGCVIEDRFLRAALMDAVKSDTAITQINEHPVVAQETTPGGITCTLKDGTRLRGQLLVGCDGRHSGVAVRAGIKRIGWNYDQASLVCAVDHERPHNGVAYQLFRPAGPLAILPLPGNRSAIVWTEDRTRAGDIHGQTPEDYLAALRPVFGNFLGAISLAGGRFLHPLDLSLAVRFIAPRVAIAGDAAHGIHPLAGQGLNLGLRDIASLAEVIAEAARRGQDIGSVAALRSYETWRRFDTAGLAAATDGLNRLFSNDCGTLHSMRTLGMDVVNKVGTLRRIFMREAAGLTGDLPRLLQGKPI